MAAKPLGKILIVEGEIGAGKTELIKSLAAAFAERGVRACSVLEPVGLWGDIGILQKFYENPGRHAYGFQTLVFATRIMAIVDAVEANPTADVYLLERSPATDPVFMHIQEGVESVEMEMYKTWCQAWQRMVPLDLSGAQILYLKTSLDACMARVTERRRHGEAAPVGAALADSGGVSFEYQARLRRAHEAYLQGYHSEEFPQMPRCPYTRSAIIEIGPEIADTNFRNPGPERTRAVDHIFQVCGFSGAS